MKREYQKPVTLIVNINMRYHLLNPSISRVVGGTLDYGGGSSTEVARGRNVDDWDDEE